MWDFQPHQFDPLRKQNLKLYHVYYTHLQSSSYRTGEEIETRAQHIHPMRYCFHVTDRSLSTHLDSSGSSSCIPVFTDRERAFKAARGLVFRQSSWGSYERGGVFVAVIDAKRLVDAGGFVFPASDLMSERRMNLQGVSHELAGMVHRGEWFVMGDVPEAAVERLLGRDAVMGIVKVIVESDRSVTYVPIDTGVVCLSSESSLFTPPPLAYSSLDLPVP